MEDVTFCPMAGYALSNVTPLERRFLEWAWAQQEAEARRVIDEAIRRSPTLAEWTRQRRARLARG